jgi:uncharacterized protein (DUF433 family)
MVALPLIPPVVPLELYEGKVYRIRGSRVPLETVVRAFKDGESAEGIMEHYPSLTLADVYAVIAYYLAHRAEVEAYLAEREAEGERVRAEVTSRADYALWRERLMARKREMDAERLKA